MTPKQVNEFLQERANKRDAEMCKNNFIRRSINELLDEIPRTLIEKTYRSGKMNELQNIVYLLERTQEVLFPDGEQFFVNIIKDERDKSRGVAGVIQIIAQYVKWIDLDNRFKYDN